MKSWYQKNSKLGDSFVSFHQEITINSSLDAKTIELIKIAVSSVFRCKHCTESHIKKAKALGINSTEITDAIMISALQAAGTQLYWNHEGLEQEI